MNKIDRFAFGFNRSFFLGLAELPALPSSMAYGDTRENAVANVQALAFRIAADKIEAHDLAPEITPFAAVFA